MLACASCSGMSTEVRGSGRCSSGFPNRLTSSSAMPFVVAQKRTRSLSAHRCRSRRATSLRSAAGIETGPHSSSSRPLKARAGCRRATSRRIRGGPLWGRRTTPPSLRRGVARSSKSSIEMMSLAGCGVARPMVARAGCRAEASKQLPVPRAADTKLRPSSGNPSAEQSAGPAFGNVP